MAEILQVMANASSFRLGATAMSDDNSVLTRGDLVSRVAGLAKEPGSRLLENKAAKPMHRCIIVEPMIKSIHAITWVTLL
jgi:hypothetical protein